MRLASFASVGVALVLIIIKFGAFLQTGSVSLLSSLFDSALDAAASIVNLIAIRHALTPADAEHRFGHGKAEPRAGLVQVAFILGSSIVLLTEVIDHFANPRQVTSPEVGIAVMVISLIATSFCTTWGGGGPSGLPMPRSITSSPRRRAAAFMAFTSANT